MTPSALIRTARTRKGWSQSDLARVCKCRPSTISRFESGTRVPSRYAIPILAAALGISVADFYPSTEKHA